MVVKEIDGCQGTLMVVNGNGSAQRQGTEPGQQIRDLNGSETDLNPKGSKTGVVELWSATAATDQK